MIFRLSTGTPILTKAEWKQRGGEVSREYRKPYLLYREIKPGINYGGTTYGPVELVSKEEYEALRQRCTTTGDGRLVLEEEEAKTG